MRGAAVLAALGLLLMACGGGEAAAPTTTTTLPTTLPATLSAVEGFFNSRGGGGWTKGQSRGPSLYSVMGSGARNATNNLCPTSIVGPAGSSAVSLLSVLEVLPRARMNKLVRSWTLRSGSSPLVPISGSGRTSEGTYEEPSPREPREPW
jgi:hypothetical protein